MSESLTKSSALAAAVVHIPMDDIDPQTKLLHEDRQNYGTTSNGRPLTGPPGNWHSIFYDKVLQKDQDAINHLLEDYDAELIEQELFVDHGKNVLHLLVDQCNSPLLGRLLNKVTRSESKVCLLTKKEKSETEGEYFFALPCLHLAAYRGFPEIATFILDQGVWVNHLNSKKETALMWAARGGNTGVVHTFLKRNADMNLCDGDGCTALHWAVTYFGSAEVVESLLNSGANLNATNGKGDTALMLAIKLSKHDIMKILLRHNADTEHKNHEGEDAWQLAVGNDTDGEDILKFLVEHVTGQGEPGDCKKCLEHVLLLAAELGNLKMIEWVRTLKPEQVNVLASNADGNNLLHFAAMNNHAHIIKEMSKFFSVNEYNNKGNTPLHEACLRGQHEAVEALINANALTNLVNLEGETALHSAAYCKTIKSSTVNILIDYMKSKGGLDTRDKESRTALHIAAAYARPDVLWEFRFVNLHVPDKFGNLALHKAVRPGKPEVLKTMLVMYDRRRNGPCDINHPNNEGQTCLLLATRQGFAENVNELIRFGAKTSLADNKGNTPLHLIPQLLVIKPEMKQEYMKILSAILDNVSVDSSNAERKAEIKRRNILELLSIRNNEGLTVFDLACKHSSCDVIQHLLSMKDVTKFKQEKDGKTYIKFDCTEIFPNMERPSCLEWFLANSKDAPHKTAEALDCEPFCYIERVLCSVARTICLIPMCLHILFMCYFSYVGLDTVRTYHYDRECTRQDDLTPLPLLAIEPTCIFGFVLFRFWMHYFGEDAIRLKLSGGRQKVLLKPYLSLGFGVIYSLVVISWIVTCEVNCWMMEYILAAALLLGWMYTMVFTRGLKSIHYLWRMIETMVIGDVLKYLFIYIFVLLAFSCAFQAIFQVNGKQHDAYEHLMDTIFLMFNMMLGQIYMFEGCTLREDGTNCTFLVGFQDDDPEIWVMKTLYAVYLLLATLLLLNLLIAMMNSSYEDILRQHTAIWRAETVDLGITLLRLLSIKPNWKLVKNIASRLSKFGGVELKYGYICPSDKQTKAAGKRWFIKIKSSKSKKTKGSLQHTDIKKTSDQTLDEMKSIMVAMMAEIKELQNSVQQSAQREAPSFVCATTQAT